MGTPSFTVESCLVAVRQACERVGLDPARAELLRLGQNALFTLADGEIVLRVARSVGLLERVAREIDTAMWPAETGFPAVRLVPDLPQPIEASGRLITFWRKADDTGAPATPADLGRILRDLHALPDPSFSGRGLRIQSSHRFPPRRRKPLGRSGTAVRTSLGTGPRRSDTGCLQHAGAMHTDPGGELELELSFSVEANADLGLLVPSPRVESYHDALYESMSLARRVRTTSHMLDRLRNTIDSEDHFRHERRGPIGRGPAGPYRCGGDLRDNRRWHLGDPVRFFGVNASEVDQSASIFDDRYLPIRLLTLAIVCTAVHRDGSATPTERA